MRQEEEKRWRREEEDRYFSERWPINDRALAALKRAPERVRREVLLKFNPREPKLRNCSATLISFIEKVEERTKQEEALLEEAAWVIGPQPQVEERARNTGEAAGRRG